jgi:hypothetical protein
LSSYAKALTVSRKYLFSLIDYLSLLSRDRRLSARTAVALAGRGFRTLYRVEGYFLVSQARVLDRTVKLAVDGTTLLARSITHRLHPPYPRLHTNGCGDFTLMAREHWLAVRGYPELEMFSFNLDSVLCHTAYNNGVKERILPDPMRIYHIEHKSGWTPRSDLDMKERLKVLGIPMLDISQFESLATRMYREKRPVILNHEDWGLGSQTLSEESIK